MSSTEFANDWTYSQLHRKASENLIAATESNLEATQSLELLKTAESYGKQALDKAGNIRQIVLSVGFLQTVCGMEVLVQRGYDLDTLRKKR